jgi:low temperature requirement protein LtrA
MLARIIVAAAADVVSADPSAVGTTATAWMVLEGAALFLTGHALFKAVVWRVTPWSRLVALILLALLGLLAPHVSALALGVRTVAVVVGVGVADQLHLRQVEVVTNGSHPAHPERTKEVDEG